MLLLVWVSGTRAVKAEVLLLPIAVDFTSRLKRCLVGRAQILPAFTDLNPILTLVTPPPKHTHTHTHTTGQVILYWVSKGDPWLKLAKGLPLVG